MKRFLFLILPLLLQTLSAQVAPMVPAKPEEPKGISLRLVSTNLSPDSKIPDWAVVGAAGEVIPLKIISWNISSPILVPMGSQLPVYDGKALAKAMESKSSLPSPVMSIPLPSGALKCLLVLRPSHRNPQGWEGQTYDESTKAYPGGSRLFLNLTNYKLSGNCGQAGFEVAPQGATLVDPKVKSDSFREVVKVFAQLPTRQATVLDEQWAFYPNTRGIILIFEAQGAVRLVGIPDEIPPEPKPAKS